MLTDMSPPTGIPVVIVSGACCARHLAQLDRQAEEVLRASAAAAGVEVSIQIVQATTLYFGGAPTAVIEQVVERFRALGGAAFPVIAVAGVPVFYGVPTIEAATAELQHAAARTVP